MEHLATSCVILVKKYALYMIASSGCLHTKTITKQWNKRKKSRKERKVRFRLFCLIVIYLCWDWAGNTKGGKYHCTIDLLFDWFGISGMTADNFCFYLQNTLIQTSQTGGQPYSDTSPWVFPGMSISKFLLFLVM